MNPAARIFLGLLPLLLLTGAEKDQPKPSDNQPMPMASTGVIEGFRIPERDFTGNLVWMISGEKAKIIQEGRIEIFNVLLETYRKGQIEQTLKSPRCTLIRQTAQGKVTTHAESTHAVEIIGKNLVITADGFHWFPDEARLVMEKNVRVVFERKSEPFFKAS